jgi:hypothetical protein
MHLRHFVVAIGVVFAAGVGCGGSGPDEPTPVCTIAIAPGNSAFGNQGGTGSVTVTTPAGCAWTAAASDGWMSVTAGAAGSGPGVIAYTVAANSATSARNGKVTVGDQTHTVTQEGRAPAICQYQLEPDSATWGNDGGNRTFEVNTSSDCGWNAVSNGAWVVVTAGQGSGNGHVSYSVARNADIAERSTTISVADRTFTVRQAGDASSCQYSVGPVTFSPCMPAGTAVASVTTQASCPWTATPDTSWITIPNGSSGMGSGAITISFPDNYDAPRQGIVQVRWPTPTAGQNIRVAQAGCLYGVSRNAFGFTSAAGSGTFDVLQQSDPIACGGATQDRCIWTAQADVPWITITSSMPRSGDNPVAFTVAANDGAARVGRITVRDKVVVVTQDPK